MAGETQLSTALTNRQAGSLRDARLAGAKLRAALDTHQFAAATELEAGDNLILDIAIPSNAIVVDILARNDDMDTGGTSLVVDIGVAAAEDFTDVTSSSETKHSRNDIIDADLFCDGSTIFQSANAAWTSCGASFDATSFGPDDALKPIWSLLGYDEDPKTMFNLVVQSQAATAGLSAAADLAVRVEYLVD